MIKLPRKILVLSVLVIVFWQISNLAPVWPQPITFANELALGQETRIFSDSDFDWGQGLIQLKQEIDERHLSDYQLAYFGNIDPKPLLGDYIRVRDINPVTTMPISELNVHKPIIISETCYYMCGYYRQPNFSINKAEVLAHSFLYFHD